MPDYLKDFIIDISYWNMRYTQLGLKLLQDWGLKAVVIRAGYGKTIDTQMPIYVSFCRNLGLPFAFYWYLYPGFSHEDSMAVFESVIKEYPDVTSLCLDIEEYKIYSTASLLSATKEEPFGTMGSGYKKFLEEQSRPLSAPLTVSYSPSYLNTFYKDSYDLLASKFPNKKVMIYSGAWILDGYVPDAYKWIRNVPYWNASYVKYFSVYQTYIASLGGSWGDESKLISITNLPKILDKIQTLENVSTMPAGLTEKVAWQCITFMPIREMTWGRNLDINLFPPKTLVEFFGKDEEPLPPPTPDGKILDVTFVSQLGEGAGMQNNDCGPACCSMVLLASNDTFVSPDQWYSIPGWGAPATDIGTTSYQLQRALGVFNVRTTVGTYLTLAQLRKFIDTSLPVIPLVDYRTLSSAGVTYYTGSFLHWLVVIGYDANNIICLDPYRPDSIGGKIIIPNQVFLNSYKGSYVALIDSIEGGAMPVLYNATVKAVNGLNIRETPGTPYGNDIGDLVDKQRIFIERVENGWGRLTVPKLGWVSMSYVILDPIAPPSLDESAIRKDELAKAKAGFDAYYTKRSTEI